MGRSSSPPETDDSGGGGEGGGAFRSIRGRFPLKRNRVKPDSDDRPVLHRSRSHPTRFNRKSLPWLKGKKSVFYFLVFLAVFLYAMSSMVLQSSITAVFRQGSDRGGRRLNREGLRIGSTLKFLPPRVSRSDGLDSLRSEPRIGVRAPRLALVSFFFGSFFWQFLLVFESEFLIACLNSILLLCN